VVQEAALRAGRLDVLQPFHRLHQQAMQVGLLLHVGRRGRRIAPWISQATSMISGTPTTSTNPSGPATMKVMAMKMKMNGRSLMADRVADEKNSRTSSIWPTMWL
jgi:hypothetical protein